MSRERVHNHDRCIKSMPKSNDQNNKAIPNTTLPKPKAIFTIFFKMKLLNLSKYIFKIVRYLYQKKEKEKKN